MYTVLGPGVPPPPYTVWDVKLLLGTHLESVTLLILFQIIESHLSGPSEWTTYPPDP